MDPARYRDLFAREARRLLDELDQAVEASPDLAAVAPALLRALHTLKGMSATMGVAGMVLVAHAAEELCQRVRDRELEPDEAVRALLGEGLTRLRIALGHVEAGEETDPGEVYDERVREALRSGAVFAFRLVRSPDEAGPEGQSREARALADAQGALADALAAARTLRRGWVGRSPAELERVEAALRQVYDRLVVLRSVPFGSVVPALRRQVRSLGERHGRGVALVAEGEELGVDEALLARLTGPLAGLVANAVVHGIEPPEQRLAAGKARRGRLRVAAERVGTTLAVVVEDDGRGFDVEALRRGRGSAAEAAFTPGVSTHGAPGLDAGRGLGLDAVRATVEALAGSLRVDSRVGQGTRVRLTVPVLADLTSLHVVELGGCVLGIRSALVEAVVPAPAPPLLELAPTASVGLRLTDGRSVGVERVLDEVELLVSAPPWPLGRMPWIRGTSVAPDGRVLFLVEP